MKKEFGCWSIRLSANQYKLYVNGEELLNGIEEFLDKLAGDQWYHTYDGLQGMRILLKKRNTRLGSH